MSFGVFPPTERYEKQPQKKISISENSILWNRSLDHGNDIWKMLHHLLERAYCGRKPRRAYRTTSHGKYTYMAASKHERKEKAPFKDHSMLEGCWNYRHKCSSSLWAQTQVRMLAKNKPALVCQSWWSEQFRRPEEWEKKKKSEIKR